MPEPANTSVALRGARLDDGAGGALTLDAPIATGGMSTVWRARREDGSASAVKIPHALYQPAPWLPREAALLERLGGSCAPRLHTVGAWETAGPPAVLQRFLAMEIVDGRPLTAVLREEAPLPAWRVVGLGRAAARALQQLHEQGVIHRDVKPGNLVVATGPSGPVVRLLDLGAAAALPGEAPAPTGTPIYQAPELADGDAGEADARSDLYALGVVLFELACGRRPFAGDPLEVLRAHADQTPPRPRSIMAGLPEPLEALLLALLEKDPARRPSSAAAVALLLEPLHAPLADGEPVATDRGPP